MLIPTKALFHFKALTFVRAPASSSPILCKIDSIKCYHVQSSQLLHTRIYHTVNGQTFHPLETNINWIHHHRHQPLSNPSPEPHLSSS